MSSASPRPELRNEDVEHALRGTLRRIAHEQGVEVPALHKEVLHIHVDGDGDHPLVDECAVWLTPCIGGSVPRKTVEAFAAQRLGLPQQDRLTSTTSYRVDDDAMYAKLVLTFANDRLQEFMFIKH